MNTDNYSHDAAFYVFLRESVYNSWRESLMFPNEVLYYMEQYERLWAYEYDKYQRFKEKYDED